LAPFRIALANLRIADTARESAGLAVEAIAQAGSEGAAIICFPECYVPGYRVPGSTMRPPDPAFLESAWRAIAAAAARAEIVVILGTERIQEGKLLASTLVIKRDGSFAGFQDKVQIDPSEEPTYAFGFGRKMFEAAGVKFGVVICHEGWRYPETVRWLAQHGAKIVFHPHFHVAERVPHPAARAGTPCFAEPDFGEHEVGSAGFTSFADPANTFHEKAMLCRAAENTVWFASVNIASPGSPSTSAVVRPDGTMLCYQPYGKEGLLIADLDISLASGLMASRCRS
jgi:predicted amidohydrolase